MSVLSLKLATIFVTRFVVSNFFEVTTSLIPGKCWKFLVNCVQLVVPLGKHLVEVFWRKEKEKEKESSVVFRRREQNSKEFEDMMIPFKERVVFPPSFCDWTFFCILGSQWLDSRGLRVDSWRLQRTCHPVFIRRSFWRRFPTYWSYGAVQATVLLVICFLSFR